MKTYVLMFQEISGDWVAVHHVAVVPCNNYRSVLRYAKDCLVRGNCDGRYVGDRCCVYCTDDHSMWELVLVNGLVEVYC